MKCPVCNKEINRPLHITKSKDAEHKNFVQSQIEIGINLLFQGKTVTEIRKEETIIITAAVEDYLYKNHKDRVAENRDKSRKENISSAMTKEDSERSKFRRRKNEIIESGLLNKDYIECAICGDKSRQITPSHAKKHNITLKEYKLKYPNNPIVCETYKEASRKRMLENNPDYNSESIKKMKITKAGTREERIRKAKEDFASGKRKLSPLSGKAIGGFRGDLGHYTRSIWEANVARILNLKNIEYQFETETFKFYDNKGELIDSYLPDFYLPEYDAYIEVKGQMDDVSLRKILMFMDLGKRLIVVEGKMYDWLCKRYKSKLGKKYEYQKRNIKTHPEIFQ